MGEDGYYHPLQKMAALDEHSPTAVLKAHDPWDAVTLFVFSGCYYFAHGLLLWLPLTSVSHPGVVPSFPLCHTEGTLCHSCRWGFLASPRTLALSVGVGGAAPASPLAGGSFCSAPNVQL